MYEWGSEKLNVLLIRVGLGISVALPLAYMTYDFYSQYASLSTYLSGGSISWNDKNGFDPPQRAMAMVIMGAVVLGLGVYMNKKRGVQPVNSLAISLGLEKWLSSKTDESLEE